MGFGPRGLGVADGQLGTKRRIDVDNLARASFERQIPCRKISDFRVNEACRPKKKTEGEEKKEKEKERERERKRRR